MIAIEGQLKQVGDMYIEDDNEDKETIVNALIQYCIRLNAILEYFKKDIPKISGKV